MNTNTQSNNSVRIYAGPLDTYAVFDVPPHASVRMILESYQPALEADFGKGVFLRQIDSNTYEIDVDKVQK